MTFITNPVFSIFFAMIVHEKAMALGGSMGIPAQLAPHHIGILSSKGLIFKETAGCHDGGKIITCATLLITSLIKTDNVVIKSIIKINYWVLSAPIHFQQLYQSCFFSPLPALNRRQIKSDSPSHSFRIFHSKIVSKQHFLRLHFSFRRNGKQQQRTDERNNGIV